MANNWSHAVLVSVCFLFLLFWLSAPCRNCRVGTFHWVRIQELGRLPHPPRNTPLPKAFQIGWHNNEMTTSQTPPSLLCGGVKDDLPLYKGLLNRFQSECLFLWVNLDRSQLQTKLIMLYVSIRSFLFKGILLHTFWMYIQVSYIYTHNTCRYNLKYSTYSL